MQWNEGQQRQVSGLSTEVLCRWWPGAPAEAGHNCSLPIAAGTLPTAAGQGSKVEPRPSGQKWVWPLLEIGPRVSF